MLYFRPDGLISRLETLIPKAELGRVMVVLGERSGELGEIIHRDKTRSAPLHLLLLPLQVLAHLLSLPSCTPPRCQATVQLISSGEVLKLDYDSVCEFAGVLPDDE